MDKQKLKLLKLWIKTKFKPYVRIEPQIKHLNSEYFKGIELGKVFQTGDFNGLHEKMSVQYILSLNLPDEDLKEFLKIFQPSFYAQLKAISQPAI